MNPREQELAVLDRCLQLAGGGVAARDKAEADICRYAAMVLVHEDPPAADHLWAAHAAYYAVHPGEPTPWEQLRSYGVTDPGRFRQMFVHRKKEHDHAR